MNVKVAKNAGFCFGVKRAMKMAWDELEKSEDGIYALGPLIHNKQAVSLYEKKGLKTVEDITSIPSRQNMIIRSHGVGEQVYIDAKNKEIDIIDTTCPFVKKIHDIVKEAHDKCEEIIVIGDEKHPEVIGINGWCQNSAIIIKNLDEANNIEINKDKNYCVVSQTTINVDSYNKIVEALSNKISNVVFNNTICSATKVRQDAVKDLSKEVDCMIVIGGKHSSNTQKLVNICKEVIPTFAIETKDEIEVESLKEYKTVGVTAGASTPDWIIKEVIEFIESL